MALTYLSLQGVPGPRYGTLTGKNSVSMTADSGGYTLSGTAASFTKGRIFAVDAGSYSTSLLSALLPVKMPAAAGTHTITGTAALLGRLVVAASGTYTVSGVYASLMVAMPAAVGAYAATGSSVDFTKPNILLAFGSSYAISGPEVFFGRRLDVDPGVYAHADGAPDFKRFMIFTDLESGGYVVPTPNIATLVVTAGFTAESGSYSINADASGDDDNTTLLFQKELAARSGIYRRRNAVTNLRRFSGLVAGALASGSYNTTGMDSGSRRHYRIHTEPIGSYFNSGQPPWLKKQFKIAGASGTYSLTGPSAGTSKNFKIAATGSSYTLSGTAVTGGRYLFMAAAGTSYAVTGVSAGLRIESASSVTSGTYNLAGDVPLYAHRYMAPASGEITVTGGSTTIFVNNRYMALASAQITVTGTDTSLLQQHAIQTDSGAIAVTGATAAFNFYPHMYADVGSYGIFGFSVDPPRSLMLTVAGGSYAVTGGSQSFGRSIVATAGTYDATDEAVGLIRLATMPMDEGVYAETGDTSGLLATRSLTTASGTYSTTFTAFTVPTGRKVSAESGLLALVVTGFDATLLKLASVKQVEDPGSYVTSGSAASFRLDYAVAPESGAYSCEGPETSLLSTRTMTATGSSYTITGEAITGYLANAIVASSGSYEAASETGLFLNLATDAEAGTYTLAGTEADTVFDHVVHANTAAYAVTGGAVGWTWRHNIGAMTGTYGAANPTTTLILAIAPVYRKRLVVYGQSRERLLVKG